MIVANEYANPIPVHPTFQFARITDMLARKAPRARSQVTPEPARKRPSSDVCYVRLGVREERLTDELALHLDSLGVECLSEGSPFEVYGVVENSATALGRLLHDPAITSVDVDEPPCCK